MAEQTAALVSPAGRASSSRPPIGLMYIASFLESKGYKAEIIDVKGNGPVQGIEDEIMRELKRLDPDIIGTTCDTPEVQATNAFSARIKSEINSEAKIVVGGSHPTFIQHDLLYAGSPIDFCILNEGEPSFAQLVDALRKEKPLSEVNNLAYFDGKKIVLTPQKTLTENLDELPFPAFEKIDMDYYLKPDIWTIRGIPIVGFFVFTSRGCPYNCSFCVNKNKSKRMVKFRSAKNVGEELQILKDKYGIDGLYFYDDTFTLNQRHVEEICAEMRERKLGLIWACETRVNLLDEPLLAKMKAAGCVQIDFGVESGSERIQKEIIDKGATPQQARDAFSLCRKHGIRTFANMMINLPTETEEDLQQTIRLARELKPTISIWNICTPYPGTDLFFSVQKEMPTEDYYRLAPRVGEFDEWLEFIQAKYNYSEHRRNLKELLQELQKEFPSIHSISLKNPKAIAGALGNLSFVFSPAYLKTIAKSRRKLKYLKWWLEIGKTLRAQKWE